MSSIEKLLIRGIRSFAPDDTNVIEFYTPLTLICGHNGAGKTTIIECLKYVTTGDLPPNSRNGAFIYDPKIANLNEVKAQVKLRFKNTSGKPLIVTRSMSLTQKKGGGYTQKSLENVLMVKNTDTGVDASLSSKCAEVDLLVPEHMGVSPAIIDNVIFCHQEESFWPLSEPSTLKKKFDDIFAATRYTKALDTIKSLKKDRTTTLKLNRQELEHVKSDEEKAHKVQRNLDKTIVKINTANERIAALEGGELEDTQRKMQNIVEDQRKWGQIDSEIQQLKNQYAMTRRQLDELENSMEVYQETDEELQQLMNEQGHHVSDQSRELQLLESERSKAERELEQVGRELSAKLATKGQLKAEQEAFNRRVQDRDALVVQLARKHHYRGFEVTPLSNEYLRSFHSKLKAEVDDALSRLESTKLSHHDQQTVQMREIQNVKSNIASLEEKRRMFRRQLESSRQKLHQLTNNINATKVSEVDIHELESRMEDAEKELKRCQDALNATDYDGKLRSLNRELQQNEAQLQKVTQEIREQSKHGDSRTRLSLKQAERDRKQETLRRTLASSQSQFERVLGTTVLSSEVEREIDQAIRRKEKQLSSATDDQETYRRELATVEANLATAKQTLRSKRSEMESKINRIKSHCDFGKFLDELKEVEQEYEQKKGEIDQYINSSDVFSRFFNAFKNNECCPLCKRGFDSDSDRRQFETTLQRKVDMSGSMKVKMQEDAESLQRRVKSLRDLRPIYDDAVRLQSDEVPELMAKVERFESQRTKVTTQVDESDSEVAGIRAELQGIRELLAHAGDIVRMQSDIKHLTQDIDSLSNELAAASSNERSLNDCQSELESLQDKCKDIRREIDRLNNDSRSKQKDISSKESTLRETQSQLQTLRKRFDERESLRKQSAETKTEIENSQSEIDASDKELHRLSPTLRELEDELASLVKLHTSQQSDVAAEVDNLRQSMQQLTSSEREIQRYVESDGDGRLRECEDQVNELEVRRERVKKKSSDLSKKIADMQKQAAEYTLIQRNIEDNIKARQLQRELQRYAQKLDELKKAAAKIDRASVTTQYDALKLKYDRLLGERAQLVGELKQLQVQVDQYNTELNTEYKDIENVYRDVLIRVRTESMAQTDLEKYAKALDQAIIRFHTLKMEEINKIIHELWVNTYQGNDIDTIEIRSDHETQKGNRSYNYRVVMRKSGQDLDMRGRCSAGQKVLCSLIIRLALAETFGLSCGVLALDEPTTNLDKENVDGLAESLSNIIKMRRKQSNFQLIIITHDEDFLQRMGKSEWADYYWRVERDEHGNSRIERKAIQDS